MTKQFQILILAVFVLLVSCTTEKPTNSFIPSEQVISDTPRPINETSIVFLLEFGTYDERIGALSLVQSLDVNRDEVIPLIVKNLYYDNNYKVREVAAEVLGNFGADAEPSIADLVNVLKTDFVHVRRAAAQALGKIGHTSAVPYLAEALNDEDEWVSIGAAEAIERVLNKDFTEYASGRLNENHVPFIVIEAKGWWQDEGRYQDWPSFPQE